jgi:L-histidine Nalpha-methyltransferase
MSTPEDRRDANLTETILRGLRSVPPSLPSVLLYDDLGSALFEAITLLPEYELTRADLRLIERRGPEEIAALPGLLDVVELGPGAGRKALTFLTPLCARQSRVNFAAIDVSPSALEGCRRALEALSGVTFHGVVAHYLDGLRRVPREAGVRRLVLFLGSNLSNFDRHDAVAFLRGVRATLEVGDALLLGTDVSTSAERLIPAYDDALGVTAAFNRNVLVRLNREWGADFDLTAFTHEARWNAPERRVEMHLVAARATEAHLHGETFRFAKGDSLWTESSHRFDVRELRAWASETGFTCDAQWVDEAWPFAHSLFVAV